MINLSDPRTKALVEHIIKSTNKYLEAIEGFNFKEFQDLMPLIEPLKHISIRQGYVLDGFMCGDERNGSFQLYVCKEGSNIQYHPLTESASKKYNPDRSWDYFPKDEDVIPYSDEKYIEGTIPYFAAKTVPSIYDYIELPFHPLSIWEAYLPTLAMGYLPKRWHGCYGMIDVITGNDSLIEACKDAVDCSGLIDDPRIIPFVQLVSDEEAEVSYCYFSAWGGVIHATVSAQKTERGVNFGEKKRETLIEYDCGLRF